MRKCGILMPVSSLPSRYGIGCFSKKAYEFIDFLKNSGQSFWQILPLGPTGFGDSPYQSFSTFAGNPYMIDLEELINNNLISKEECDNTDFGNDNHYIDYGKQFENRIYLLRKAFANCRMNFDNSFDKFCSENNFWLDDYSLFMALKYHYNQKPWNMWDEKIKKRNHDAIVTMKSTLNEEIKFWKFTQYLFFTQWKKIKEYANKNSISIIGDLPIYVSYDSADVWANPILFELDEALNPTCVSGCPPDGFSPSGQLWGNPIYNWPEHKRDEYSWWIKRLSHAFDLYDVLRLDHFRGFDEYYAIKYPSPDATRGKWCPGPGKELFDVLKKKRGNCNIIAEDLGFITESVKKLLADCGYPGMRILEFAFDSRDTGETSEYLPHNYIRNCVAYTGTHDNMPVSSWFDTISTDEKDSVRQYLCDRYTPDSEIHFPLISLLMRSNADLCIIPIQDWLGLGEDSRINTPSTQSGNWKWRISESMITGELSKKMYSFSKAFGRL